jgi:hypothetical protein
MKLFRIIVLHLALLVCYGSNAYAAEDPVDAYFETFLTERLSSGPAQLTVHLDAHEKISKRIKLVRKEDGQVVFFRIKHSGGENYHGKTTLSLPGTYQAFYYSKKDSDWHAFTDVIKVFELYSFVEVKVKGSEYLMDVYVRPMFGFDMALFDDDTRVVVGDRIFSAALVDRSNSYDMVYALPIPVTKELLDHWKAIYGASVPVQIFVGGRKVGEKIGYYDMTVRQF